MTNQELATITSMDRSTIPPEGNATYNSLIHCDSPYLLQHAKNPVRWRPFDPALLTLAKECNRPLFVSIGYATCHWCHVMAHECFEDEEVADLLNNAFIPVKVDREEHPDLDAYCMAALTAQTGQGGWPLNCFMDTDGRPFYGITYLPPRAQGNRPGLVELLENIHRVWSKNPAAIAENAENIRLAITPRRSSSAALVPEAIQEQILRARRHADSTLLKRYDEQQGGFGTAPKFPMPPYLYYCLTHPDERFVTMAVTTIDTIFKSGSYDQLAGGVHRYATDPAWQIPHFEKMLYDQALVCYCATLAHERTGHPSMLACAEGIAMFCKHQLLAPDGTWYSALDADSEGEEGTYYLWRYHEILALFGEKLGREVADYFAIPPAGLLHLAGKATLHPLAQDGPPPAWYREVTGVLLTHRQKRELPLIDTKRLTAWNGLMMAALARLAITVPDSWYGDAALTTWHALQRELHDPQIGFLHSSGRFPHPQAATTEDLTALAFGLSELALATGQETLSNTSQELCQLAQGLMTNGQHHNHGMPYPYGALDPHDGVIPSPQSLYAMARHRSSKHWPDDGLDNAEHLQRTFAQPVNQAWFLATLPYE